MGFARWPAPARLAVRPKAPIGHEGTAGQRLERVGLGDRAPPARPALGRPAAACGDSPARSPLLSCSSRTPAGVATRTVRSGTMPARLSRETFVRPRGAQGRTEPARREARGREDDRLRRRADGRARGGPARVGDRDEGGERGPWIVGLTSRADSAVLFALSFGRVGAARARLRGQRRAVRSGVADAAGHCRPTGAAAAVAARSCSWSRSPAHRPYLIRPTRTAERHDAEARTAARTSARRRDGRDPHAGVPPGPHMSDDGEATTPPASTSGAPRSTSAGRVGRCCRS